MKVRRLLLISGLVSFMAGGSCSTTQVEPLPEIPPKPPGYVRVPHPEGLDLGDLVAIFTERDAPQPESLADCDQDFMKLRKLAGSKDELEQGAREFAKLDPVKYHWCFYGKIMLMEKNLQSAVYIDERQKSVIETYLFLTPMARAFMHEYQDSRYLRWAIVRYRKLSEHVFYRRVELTPQATSELAYAESPLGNLRPDTGSRKTVLEKYGLIPPTPEVPPATPVPPVSDYPGGAPQAAASAAPPAVDPNAPPTAPIAAEPTPLPAPAGMTAQAPSQEVEAKASPLPSVEAPKPPEAQTLQTRGTASVPAVDRPATQALPDAVKQDPGVAKPQSQLQKVDRPPAEEPPVEALLNDGALTPVEQIGR